MEIMRFERLPVPDMARWRRESGERPSRHWEKVSDEARGARSLTLLVMPYAPYLPTAEGVEISAFYVASNALHAMAGRDGLDIPVKPLAAGYGIGAYGRSGLISIPGAGTRFAAAVIKSDSEPDEKWIWEESRPLADGCADCRICVDVCPTRALQGNGRLNVDKCLRAQAQYQTPRMPDSSRSLIGVSAWGCELCQENCPRNAGILPVKMPDGLENALQLKRLLLGDVKALGEWIGTNYARTARMQARGCLVAANMGRHDLIGEIRALTASPVEPVRDCAQWALNKLQNGGY